MLSMGLTLTFEDFRRCLRNPWTVGVGFIAQYCIKPILGYAIALALKLPAPLATGLILVSCCPGGQASNVATYISRGNVALSVLMTTASTIGAIFMTPFLTKVLAGQLVPVDAKGLALSTFQVVLVPTICGVLANEFFNDITKKITFFTPLVGVVLTTLLCASPIGQVAEVLKAQGAQLILPVAALHAFAFALGYFLSKIFNFSESTSRTISIECGMQSSALGFLLAQKHFSNPLVAVPSAVSVVFMARARLHHTGEGRTRYIPFPPFTCRPYSLLPPKPSLPYAHPPHARSQSYTLLPPPCVLCLTPCFPLSPLFPTPSFPLSPLCLNLLCAPFPSLPYPLLPVLCLMPCFPFFPLCPTSFLPLSPLCLTPFFRLSPLSALRHSPPFSPLPYALLPPSPSLPYARFSPYATLPYSPSSTFSLSPLLPSTPFPTLPVTRLLPFPTLASNRLLPFSTLPYTLLPTFPSLPFLGPLRLCASLSLTTLPQSPHPPSFSTPSLPFTPLPPFSLCVTPFFRLSPLCLAPFIPLTPLCHTPLLIPFHYLPYLLHHPLPLCHSPFFSPSRLSLTPFFPLSPLCLSHLCLPPFSPLTPLATLSFLPPPRNHLLSPPLPTQSLRLSRGCNINTLIAETALYPFNALSPLHAHSRPLALFPLSPSHPSSPLPLSVGHPSSPLPLSPYNLRPPFPCLRYTGFPPFPCLRYTGFPPFPCLRYTGFPPFPCLPLTILPPFPSVPVTLQPLFPPLPFNLRHPFLSLPYALLPPVPSFLTTCFTLSPLCLGFSLCPLLFHTPCSL
ncbi:unnamed protein product [Closterium sp. Naga37s-1]|nr:unnamed protein product [Closterium sp. Naga37s-1]